MSEGRLDTSNKSNLTSRVMWLLTRHITVQQCPLSLEELATIYDAALGALSEAKQALYRAAKDAVDGTTASLPLYRPSMTGMPIQLSTGHRLMFQIDGHQLWLAGLPVLSAPSSLTSVLMLERVELPPDRMLAFEDWAIRAAETAGKVVQSLGTAEKLISMANTAGQLDRMCPEFLRYISDDKRKHAAGQVRRSPFPDGWDDVNRAHIRAMVNHLAVCALAAEGLSRWNTTVMDVTTSVHWAFDQTTRGWLHSSSQPHKHLVDKLSKFDAIEGSWAIS